MLHSYETTHFNKCKDRSLLDRILLSINPLWIVVILPVIMIGSGYLITYLADDEPKNLSNNISIEAPVDVEGLLRSSISNVQKHGKLVVTSMDLQSTSSKEIPGMVSTTSITTVSWAKVQYAMDLRKFDPSWISAKGTDVLITIPQDYVKAEILGTNSKDIDNSGWWSSDEEKKSLHSENVKVNEAQMMTQANSMLEVVRPAAAQELKSMFSIPLKAVDLKFTIKVNVG